MPQFTKELSFSTVNQKILNAIRPPARTYLLVMGSLAALIGWGVIIWIYSTKTGMHVTGLNHPVGWGVYITNFVFWVGIAHSGTLISAILYLLRSKWRDAVSRSTEAMTVFAVITAALFPLIHLGRVWVFYYMLPYPNERGLYPNFMSPLVLDLIAVLTYLIVSMIFFYFGLIPDAAAARDSFSEKYGKDHWRAKFFHFLSLGWSGSLNEWKHYNRSYLLFAMLATPLVVSVHSIVSWDFASGILPGWHSTIFAPYFVAGAIHSGLAMALTLIIPMRKLLGLKALITKKHLEKIAQLLIFTSLILAYTYIIEPFIEIYSGNVFHVQFGEWRRTGSISWIYYLFIALNILVPFTFFFRKMRRHIHWLFLASILINIGMWLERYFIVVGSTMHDFLPHNWGNYLPTWVEVSISAGMAAFFIFSFLAFAKLLPVISIADFKDYLLKEKAADSDRPAGKWQEEVIRQKGNGKRLYVFTSAAALTAAVKDIYKKGFRELETFSPVKLEEVEKTLRPEISPVRYWTFAGGVAGFISAFALTIGSVNIFNLIVGGKHPVSLLPYILIMFELTILFATLANLLASLICSGMYRRRIHPYYDKRFSTDKFGLLISYPPDKETYLENSMAHFAPEEERDPGKEL